MKRYIKSFREFLNESAGLNGGGLMKPLLRVPA
jgi:hypothetical protein